MNKFFVGISVIVFFLGIILYDPLATKKETTIFYDRDGATIAKLSWDGGVSHYWVPLKDIDPQLIKVFLALEDKRFYYHLGIDPIAVVRSLYLTIKTKEVYGGSTITQQLAKNILHIQKRTIANKFGELFLTGYLELRYSKQTILENYLNRIYYGSLVQGVGTAAEIYFGKMIKQLTIRDAVQLSIWAHSPPVSHEQSSATIAAVEALLHKLYIRKVIDLQTYEYAQQLKIRGLPERELIIAPHVVQLLYAKGYRGKVYTTIDKQIQEYVEDLVNAEITNKKKQNIHNAAVVVVDNRKGQVLAYVGTADYAGEQGGSIDGVNSPRQPGSALKPFLYYLAFKKGYTAATVLPDLRMAFPSGTGVFVPRNFDEKYRGPVTIRRALANSLNIPAVFMLSLLDLGQYVDLLKTVGLSTINRPPNYYGLGLTLGNAEVTLLDLTKAYVTLANQGIAYKTLALTCDEKNATQNVLDKELVFIVTHILADNNARQEEFGEYSPLAFDFPVAAKTGTTVDFRDNWAFGYTPDYTVGVWVGNHDQSEMRNSSGVIGAGPIMHAVLEKVNAGRASAFIQPKQVVSRTICLGTGLLAGPHCIQTGQEFFILKQVPDQVCEYHVLRKGKWGCIYTPEYRAWQTKAIDQSAIYEKTITTSCQASIVFPVSGTYFAIDPGIPLRYQKIALRSNASSHDRVTWFVDGQFYGWGRGSQELLWSLRRGRHEIRLQSSAGAARSIITVY